MKRADPGQVVFLFQSKQCVGITRPLGLILEQQNQNKALTDNQGKKSTVRIIPLLTLSFIPKFKFILSIENLIFKSPEVNLLTASLSVYT